MYSSKGDLVKTHTHVKLIYSIRMPFCFFKKFNHLFSKHFIIYKMKNSLKDFIGNSQVFTHSYVNNQYVVFSSGKTGLGMFSFKTLAWHLTVELTLTVYSFSDTAHVMFWLFNNVNPTFHYGLQYLSISPNITWLLWLNPLYYSMWLIVQFSCHRQNIISHSSQAKIEYLVARLRLLHQIRIVRLCFFFFFNKTLLQNYSLLSKILCKYVSTLVRIMPFLLYLSGCEGYN